MKPHQYNYILDVGKQDEQRLGLLDEAIGAGSRQLLLEAGLSAGKQVLEMGCGTGNMTRFIAEQVGESGRVTAVDISHEQLTIAKKNCGGLKQITFIESAIFDLKELPQFDFIYCRFIVIHLPKPAEALQFMLRFLKPGGKIVCEEATNRVFCCYPYSSLYQKSRELLLMLADRKNLDFDFGEKLYGVFHDLKLKNIFVKFTQPIFTSKKLKKIIPLLMSSLKSQFIANNFITENEINTFIDELYHFIEDDRYLISFPRTTQIYGSKE